MKQSKRWWRLTTVTALLLAILLMLSDLAWGYESVINSTLHVVTQRAVLSEDATMTDTAYYKSAYGDVNNLTAADLEKLRQAEDAFVAREMEEGAVLLKNDGDALPLSASERKVTLFGSASAKPLYQNNSGGGDDDLDRRVSFYQAMKDVGFTINEALYQAYVNSPTARTVGNFVAFGGEGGASLGEEPASFYTETLKNTFADYSDAAIVVITRESGEDNDLPIKDSEGLNYLALHRDEKDLLTMIRDAGVFGKIILINNSPNPLEMGFLDEYGIDACLWIGTPGLTGFRGVANLLTGAANPSGKLSEIYAASALSSPAMQTYGDYSYTNREEVTAYCEDPADGVENYLIYGESIYVGYRYYETRYEDSILGQGNADSSVGTFASKEGKWNYADEVIYPFGYGLSYTTFNQKLDTVTENGDTLTVKATVTNTGKVAGKSVVEVYAQVPYTDYDRENLVEKSAVQLAGFAKTGLIQPGASETVTIEVDKYFLTSYDYKNAKTYIMDAGDYYLAIGDDSHDALNHILAAKGAVGMFDPNGYPVAGDAAKTWRWTQKQLDTETWRYSRVTGKEITNQLDDGDLNYWVDNGVTYLSRQDWEGTFPKPVEVTATEAMMKELNGYLYETSADAPSLSSWTQGAENGISFVDMKDKAYDDEIWNEFLDQLTLDDMTSIVDETWGSAAVDKVKKPQSINVDGPQGIQNSYPYQQGDATDVPTDYVGELVAASSWNLDLLAERGAFLAEDGLFTGVSHLWGPGGDVHRTPFSGRNFEYYSEDPVLAYLCAEAQTVAMQEKGLIPSIKHFFGNDQEINRAGVAEYMTEQAAREIYMKGFEGALTRGRALGTMTSYNRHGCTYVGHSIGIQRNILRGEWGFEGVIISDGAVWDYQHAVEGLVGGTDFWCLAQFYAMISKKGIVRAEYLNSYIREHDDGYLYSLLREANHNFYYAFVHSNLINGLDSNITFETVYPWWKTTIITIDSVLGTATLCFAALYLVSRRKKKEQ